MKSDWLHLTVISWLLVITFPYVSCDKGFYTNNWAVRVEGGMQEAIRIAAAHGLLYIDQILDDYYLFQAHHISKRSLDSDSQQNAMLEHDSKVLWYEQQRVLKRLKRDFIFNDVNWKRQWYLDRPDGSRPVLDMNIISAWSQGYTGKGVVVAILDDGVERTHPDLIDNYDSLASRDINDNDLDPTPRYEQTNENRHGTRCAGEVAASANNSICGVGVAYQVKLGGIRMLDGDVTDSVEAMSLSSYRDYIDIYSASWGPDDDGRTVDGPGILTKQAFKAGVLHGRNGKGSIFVWASGNGGRKDNCNCDGYTNSIYTLSISSTTENGYIPWYSEACSSTLATTYSSGDSNERQIVTTDLRKSCTDAHSGTSASAPLAAGIVALALQANPLLTWRDLQYIIVMTSNPNNLQADDWITNGVGRRVSHHFGYGMMDAGKIVNLAINWTNVPSQLICEQLSTKRNITVPAQGRISVVLSANACEGAPNHIQSLEHVQARISLTSAARGEVSIWLTSPMGTKSMLLSPRPNDGSKNGFNEWEFMTTHMWSEYASGDWTLEIANSFRAHATLLQFTIVLYGTSADSPPDRNNFVSGHPPCQLWNVKYKGECLQACPTGWYSNFGVCLPCHMTCATCHSASNTSCLECYHGSTIVSGTCMRIESEVLINAELSPESRFIKGRFWWIMVGTTISLCIVLTFLILLAISYAIKQDYLKIRLKSICTRKHKDESAVAVTEMNDILSAELLHPSFPGNLTQFDHMNDSFI